MHAPLAGWNRSLSRPLRLALALVICGVLGVWTVLATGPAAPMEPAAPTAVPTVEPASPSELAPVGKASELTKSELEEDLFLAGSCTAQASCNDGSQISCSGTTCQAWPSSIKCDGVTTWCPCGPGAPIGCADPDAFCDCFDATQAAQQCLYAHCDLVIHP